MEWTSWAGSWENGWSKSGEHREIVQIGAVKLETDQFKEVEFFQMIVKPVVNPFISEYFVNLTGITQDQIDQEGFSLKDAINRFSCFIDGAQSIFSNGGDEEVFQENCDLIGISYPFKHAPFIDAHPFLLEHTGLDSASIVSSALPKLLGLPALGRSHNALADARSLATALRQFNFFKN